MVNDEEERLIVQICDGVRRDLLDGVRRLGSLEAYVTDLLAQDDPADEPEIALQSIRFLVAGLAVSLSRGVEEEQIPHG